MRPPRAVRPAALAACAILLLPAAAARTQVRPVELGESLWSIAMRYADSAPRRF